MAAVELTNTPGESRPLPPWRDLIFYLVFGLGGYLIASLAVKFFFNPTKMTVPLSLLAYTLNVLFIGGSVLLLSAWRKQLDLRAIGFFPPRVTMNQVILGVFVSLFILPLRALAGAIVQQLTGGSLDASQMRLELIAPDGFTWIGFLVSLVGAGILAPIAEELFFRGAIFTWFRGRYNFLVAMLVSATLFGLAHFDTAAVVASSFIFGLAAAFMFERTRTLWVPITMHITSNCFAVCFIYLALAFSPKLLQP